jgi:hypothetical protein
MNNFGEARELVIVLNAVMSRNSTGDVVANVGGIVVVVVVVVVAVGIVICAVCGRGDVRVVSEVRISPTCLSVLSSRGERSHVCAVKISWGVDILTLP